MVQVSNDSLERSMLLICSCVQLLTMQVLRCNEDPWVPPRFDFPARIV
jgi:hypothetical protein